ncbi:fungal-specific transcription factor domain-containing protein [Penicillium riverlandense]|uniref:fungal-specific transcription factor domain-containing protein n=1 Tax=Penicillium riverlandense TaxID=1903569 RepID=UPI00254869D0|nr:fungal-specific transcription factor domain-containing protein [Penicillium riverlandense]KAJ5820424.1 fungal-specific transcription factor domain-containing protein [Penicillium riverlandense]
MASWYQDNSGTPESLLGRNDAVQHCKKRRASHVCQGCRKRKVKCDLVVSGTPCSNCREDGIACIELESKRGRRYRQQKRRLDHAASNPSPPSSSAFDRGSSACNVAPSSHEHIPTQAANALSYPEESASCLDGYISASRQVLSQLSHFVELPAYVKAIHAGFDSENIGVLASRGALAIPEAGVRDELIGAFVLYVHPYMPVLDLQDFFQSIHQTENSNPCSLILLQAVMFSGSAFVDMSVLETMGFRTRIDARKAFYMKVKYLYEFDWEPDPVPVIQALLLITCWFESPEDKKDPWYWLGVCHILAKRIGLGSHHKTLRNPPKARGLLNRLWWVCIFRDRMLAIAARKPLQFREEDVMPLLTLEDFETQPIDAGIDSLRNSAVLKDPEIRQTLARLCIEKIKVGLLITRILTWNYSPSSISESLMSSVMLYSPNHHMSNLDENIKLRCNLEEWQKALPDDCVFTEPSIYAQPWALDEEVLFVHRAVLHMFSLMTLGLFYRALLSAKTDPTHESHFPRHDVKREVAKVADETARMARLFCEQNLVQKLPIYATTFFISALPTFLVGVKSPTEALCGDSRSQFRWCSEAIFQQRDIWPTAGHAYAMIQDMVSRAQLQDAQGLIRESLSPDDPGNDTMFPNRGLGPDLNAYGGTGMTLPAAAPSTLIPDGNRNIVGVLPENTMDGAGWVEFNALFNQYCNSAEAYPTG